ncbi:MAG: GNAT family N-acetyltransferase [Candidatus Aminicenantia bacterium]
MIEIRKPKKEERSIIEDILRSSGVFRENEIRVALELIDLNLSGFEDYIVEVITDDGRVYGYICYGENPVAPGIWELYWICVKPELYGKGYGEKLYLKMEGFVKSKNGRAIIIETSSLPSYEKARKFYEKVGFRIVCVIENFYQIGDHKIIFRKDLSTF